MRGPGRLSLLAPAIAAVGLLAVTGCSAKAVAGKPQMELSPTPPHTACADVIHGDPWIAFAEPLHDGDRLEVGQRGWISSPAGGSTAIKVGGDTDAVVLTDESSATVIQCGVTTASTKWVEVHANRPGTATLTMPGQSAALHVTVIIR
jgi:hypothetical protein